MNHPSQFAQPFSWGIAAKAADARPSLLPASAATYHRQHGSTHERGRGVPELGMLSRASIPTDGRWGHVHSFVAYPVQEILPLSGLRELGRGLRALGSFPADGRDCNPCLANIHALDHSLNDAVQALKAHSKVPFRYVHKRSGGLVVNVQFPVGEVGNV